jgi:hypothetical protein
VTTQETNFILEIFNFYKCAQKSRDIEEKDQWILTEQITNKQGAVSKILNTQAISTATQYFE